MDEAERKRRETVFSEAKAAILGARPALAEGVQVVRLDGDAFVLRYRSGAPETELGTYAGQFMHHIDGRRTVGDIIEAIADDLAMTDAMEAGKASMAALHVYYVDGTIEELRGI